MRTGSVIGRNRMRAVREVLRRRINWLGNKNPDFNAQTERMMLAYLHEMLDPKNADTTIDAFFAANALVESPGECETTGGEDGHAR